LLLVVIAVVGVGVFFRFQFQLSFQKHQIEFRIEIIGDEQHLPFLRE
jgi:hypothetical protein